MAKVIVDGQEVEIGDAERLNGIQAAKRAGVEIPHYCWHAGLAVVASCRMCLVETGTLNSETGQVSMFPKLVPACQTPAKDGTVFVTNSDKVKQAHAQVEESLLLRHPVDCPVIGEHRQLGDVHLHISNLSAHGFMAVGEHALGRGERITIRLPVIGRIEAHVIWIVDERSGFQFERIIRLEDFTKLIDSLQPNPRLRRAR